MPRFHDSLSLFGIGQLSPPILHLTVLQEAVVLLPSRADLFSATPLFPRVVLLLPKLRSHLAEFLNPRSPLPLGTYLYPPVSVSCTNSYVSPTSRASLLLCSHPHSLDHTSHSRLRLPPSALLLLSPLAFQLRIKVRLSLLTTRYLLEPLGLWPFRFSLSSSLLIQAYSLVNSVVDQTVRPIASLLSVSYRNHGSNLSCTLCSTTYRLFLTLLLHQLSTHSHYHRCSVTPPVR